MTTIAAPLRVEQVALRRAATPVVRTGMGFQRSRAASRRLSGAVLVAGVGPHKPPIRRAVAWLEHHQNPDGGWGEDLRSYRDPEWIGYGASTASQTAWALLALLAAGERSEAVERGVAYLVNTQREDGTWDEDQFTGTGFPGDFYINYHLYRLVFPISALGRFLAAGS